MRLSHQISRIKLSLKVLQPYQILEQEDEVFRIQTAGKCQSIIRNDEIAYLDQDYLMVRLDTGSNPYERRALFNFKDDQVDWSKTRSARLRLNLVPCGLGHRESAKFQPSDGEEIS